ncbi:hypothetical protein KY289_008606 [Solanum tuberosum]|nr:hypothetical protein KY289_008606 [Solanum tuberosum]
MSCFLDGNVHFVCNSWVYPAKRYKSEHIFFANQAYLPGETPEPLCNYREKELVNLRGDGNGKLEEWDRVYDYGLYNYLGDPEKGKQYARTILGGSAEYPYPRRGRTGRKPTKADPKSESRIPLLMSLDIYVPRDERFGHIKLSDFLTYALKSIVQFLIPEFQALFDSTPDEFDSFEDSDCQDMKSVSSSPCLKFEQKLTSSDDYLVQEFSLIGKVFQQFIFL